MPREEGRGSFWGPQTACLEPPGQGDYDGRSGASGSSGSSGASGASRTDAFNVPPSCGRNELSFELLFKARSQIHLNPNTLHLSSLHYETGCCAHGTLNCIGTSALRSQSGELTSMPYCHLVNPKKLSQIP